MNIIITLLICLGVTIVSECLLSMLFGIRKMDLLTVLFVNIITNPLLNTVVNYVDLAYSNKVRLYTFIIGEIVVFLFEGFLFKKFLENKKINPFILSFVINAFSLIIGLLLDKFIW